MAPLVLTPVCDEVLSVPLSLSVEHDVSRGVWYVSASGLGPGLSASSSGRLQSLLRVKVAQSGEPDHDELPSVSGDYLVLGDEVRFIPHFPFEPGLSFRAILDLRILRQLSAVETVTRDFSFPAPEMPHEASEVIEVYPSSRALPANLLRFYVRFSTAMRRGRVEDNVEILGPDNRPVPDVLYRAPVELWDHSMTCLTILLDPGRLKRGVGPNLVLGPPLIAGQQYALKIGAGMTDVYRRPLRDIFLKRFIASEAVRAPVELEEWTVRSPAVASRRPVELIFTRPLDWAQLRRGIAVTSDRDQPIGGCVNIDRDERRCCFTPDAPWASGSYRIYVSPNLEDLSGNTPTRPFDGPLRTEGKSFEETARRWITFVV